MAQGVRAHQGYATGVGGFAEEERDKRVTVAVRTLDARRVEVTSTTETYADDKPWEEESDETSRQGSSLRVSRDTAADPLHQSQGCPQPQKRRH